VFYYCRTYYKAVASRLTGFFLVFSTELSHMAPSQVTVAVSAPL
jgi:hypothetical protein